jgi:dTDP-4-dehydrorhamnose reductase
VKLLVIGKNGQLASALASLPPAADLEITFAGLPEVDLTKAGSAMSAITDAAPDIIINTAAYTAVDQAEHEPERAFAVNDRGAGEIGAAAASVGARLIHVSTDYVFDGRSNHPLTETSPTGPVNVYGQSKLAGEQAVRKNCADALIVRTSWLYGPYGSNFVQTVLRLAMERDELRIVDDQVGSPTSASDLAEALLGIAARWRGGDRTGAGEIYHFAGSEACSWAEFARGIVEMSAELGAKRAAVVPIASKDYPTAATRPAYTVLDCSKFDRDFDLPRRGWRTALAPVVGELVRASGRKRSRAS